MSLSRSRNSRRIARKHEGILTAAIEGVGRPSYIAITLHNEVGLLSSPPVIPVASRTKGERKVISYESAGERAFTAKKRSVCALTSLLTYSPTAPTSEGKNEGAT